MKYFTLHVSYGLFIPVLKFIYSNVKRKNHIKINQESLHILIIAETYCMHAYKYQILLQK